MFIKLFLIFLFSVAASIIRSSSFNKLISVIGDIMLFGDEYLIGEDLDGNKYVFIYIKGAFTCLCCSVRW